jgi:hypothetical protein
MAKALSIPAIEKFDVHGDQTTLSQRWDKWLTSFNYFVIASGITDKGQKRALLLHLVGTDTQEFSIH